MITQEKHYCTKCGAGLVSRNVPAEESFWADAYDSKTGERLYILLRECPNSSWLDGFFMRTEHDGFYSGTPFTL